ncbi:expressed unknown protein [Seminavis robusta]|uniref:Uncharacterized protein n=1 Tax=Seminavis robusta TaxID=568900 RepID=A0A9N8EDE3_9STRA|nr:expressed unknown protein [Seminavis robusta]|eukprot:Sro986_g228170.1 n/a (413) ;mRNA; f:34380-35618
MRQPLWMVLETCLVLVLIAPPKAALGFVTPDGVSRQSVRRIGLPPTRKSWLCSGRQSDGWELSNDFPQFLNQCSIQTFLVVLGTLREPQTIRWMDNFTQPLVMERDFTNRDDESSPSKLLTYHGLGAMNTDLFPTWDSYFATLLEQPQEEFLVQTAAGSLHTQEYELEINPASLCTRLISIREQIAQEFTNDLGVVANAMGRHTMDSYWDYLDNNNQEQENNDNDNDDNQQDTFSEALGDVVNTGGGTGTTTTTQRRFPPHNLVFLGYALDAIDGFTPSPLRQHNFDLAVLLATQEAIHRILNNNKYEDSKERISRQYLQEFYVQRLDSHFFGTQRYGRADDFLEELLFVNLPPAVSEAVDPVLVTEMILEERRQVALEWQAKSQDVPTHDHIQIKRLQLDRLMASYGTNDN